MNQENRIKDPYYRSLTRKMLIIFIAVSIAPLITVSGIILNRFSVSYNEKLNAHLGELVLKHRQNIDGFLLEKLNNIRFMARSFTVDELKNEKFLRNNLAALQTEYGSVFEDLGIINDKGIQDAYAGPFKLENARYSDTEWFRKAIKSDFFISDVFLGLRGIPHFIITVRQMSNGKPWILRATISFVAFNSLVENLRIGKTGFAFILNSKGEFQSKPGFEVVHEKSYSFYESIKSGRKTKDGVFFSEMTDASGQKNLYVASLIKNGDWILIYQQDKSDAFSDLTHAKQIAFFIILIGGIVIIVTAFLLSKRMVARIAQADGEKELMNQQVIETGKLASLGELAAGIAHEINNPVAIMVEEAGWVHDLMEEEQFSSKENKNEFERALLQIKTQGKRCREITQKLLSFARKTDTCVEDVRINDVINEVISFCVQRAKFSNVVIKSNLQDNLPLLCLSHTEIQQVLLNLMNNALDSLEKRGGIITLTNWLEGDEVVISVADNGPGIPRANLARIFDPFFTTKPVGKGTGLGLSICYGIIKKMGGEIDVRSVVDAGTTFYLRVPTKKND
ncbi:MAG: two-component system, NtrC family, sensor kinase [Thermodesulfobacteriota bacterium]|nr:two-component system, NtrC family, sensor kinase [Thermodesulfobacteriota bacterium]